MTTAQTRDPEHRVWDPIARAARVIASADALLILTGAGMSVDAFSDPARTLIPTHRERRFRSNVNTDSDAS